MRKLSLPAASLVALLAPAFAWAQPVAPEPAPEVPTAPEVPEPAAAPEPVLDPTVPVPETTSVDIDDREARAKAAEARRAQRHDSGFLNAWSGGGYTLAKTKLLSETVTMSGPDASIGLAGGTALADNVIGFLSVEAHRTPKVDVSFAGKTNELAKVSSLTTYTFGGGFTYYFMPINIFAGGEVFMSLLDIDNTANNETQSCDGLGLSLKAGKEWWVSPNWGVGVALRYLVSSIEDPGFGENINTRWNLSILTLAFSATYN